MAVLFPVSYYAKTSTLDREGVAKRAAKLVINTSQNRVDNFSFVGAMVGATTGLLFKRSLGGLLKGSTLGVAGGVAVHVSMNLMEELKRRVLNN